MLRDLIDRRRMLISAAALPALAGCSLFQGTSASQLSSYIAAIASGLKTILTYVGLQDATLKRYQADVDLLVQLAQEILTNTSSSKSIVQQAIAAAQDALSLLSGLNLPTTAKSIIAALQVVLGVLSGFVGTKSEFRATMSVDEAMIVLTTTR